MNTIPEWVQQYLNELDSCSLFVGYLCLNENEQITHSNGQVGDFNLAELDNAKTVVQCVPFLEGLLPEDTKTNSIIGNVHIDDYQYFDIHIVNNASGYWILFIDTTRSAKQLQHEQQLRLDVDFDNDKRKTGS